MTIKKVGIVVLCYIEGVDSKPVAVLERRGLYRFNPLNSPACTKNEWPAGCQLPITFSTEPENLHKGMYNALFKFFGKDPNKVLQTEEGDLDPDDVELIPGLTKLISTSKAVFYGVSISFATLCLCNFTIDSGGLDFLKEDYARKADIEVLTEENREHGVSGREIVLFPDHLEAIQAAFRKMKPD